MTRIAPLVAMLLVPVSAIAAETDVPAAIAYGTQNARTGGAGFAPYRLRLWEISTPFSRVARAAAEATAKYKPFAASDATPEMLAPTFTIKADGSYNQLDPSYSSSYEHMVIVDTSGTIVQPVAITPTVNEVKNRLNATLATLKGVIATFPLTALHVGNEIRAVLEGGREEKVLISAKFLIALPETSPSERAALDARVNDELAAAAAQKEKEIHFRLIDELERIKDPSGTSREAAISAIGSMDPNAARSAVPALAAALTDKDFDVRKAAARALANFGPVAKEAVPALEAARQDKSLGLAAEARRALEEINQ